MTKLRPWPSASNTMLPLMAVVPSIRLRSGTRAPVPYSCTRLASTALSKRSRKPVSVAWKLLTCSAGWATTVSSTSPVAVPPWPSSSR